MSGFSPAWLALREPADGRARNGQVLAACASAFSGHDSLAICDMGAGTGVSIRAFADILPVQQHWTLVDHAADNLAAAVEALSGWADEVISPEPLILRRGERRLEVRTRVFDFAETPACWPAGTELVTASALLDLASAAWIARLVAELARQNTALLATLTVDGVMTATPAHDLDAEVAGHFRRHQTRDKGFGPAAGADAPRILERELHSAGCALTAGDSPWELASADAPLKRELIAGIAAAVAETGAMKPADLSHWRAFRAADTATLTIGHRDVFALRR